MVRKTKRKGGMIRTFARPVGKATMALGESVGKDYLQKKSIKVAQGIYEDSSLAKNPNFLLTGNKPVLQPKFSFYDKENVRQNVNVNINNKENANPNLGGRSRRKYKKRKHRKTRKT